MYMNKLILFIALALVLVGCSQSDQKPANLIERDQMVDVLYDVALLYAIEGTPRPFNDTIIKVDLSSVFNKYAIDSLRFVQSNRYYINLHKGVYYKMQEEILSRLEQELQAVDSLDVPVEVDAQLQPILLDTQQDSIQAVGNDSLSMPVLLEVQ